MINNDTYYYIDLMYEYKNAIENNRRLIKDNFDRGINETVTLCLKHENEKYELAIIGIQTILNEVK